MRFQGGVFFCKNASTKQASSSRIDGGKKLAPLLPKPTRSGKRGGDGSFQTAGTHRNAVSNCERIIPHFLDASKRLRLCVRHLCERSLRPFFKILRQQGGVPPCTPPMGEVFIPYPGQ